MRKSKTKCDMLFGPCEPLFDGLGDLIDSAIVRSHTLMCLNHLCGVLLQQVPVMNTDSTTEQPKR